jgi:hypothetical protein
MREMLTLRAVRCHALGDSPPSRSVRVWRAFTVLSGESVSYRRERFGGRPEVGRSKVRPGRRACPARKVGSR